MAIIDRKLPVENRSVGFKGVVLFGVVCSITIFSTLLQNSRSGELPLILNNDLNSWQQPSANNRMFQFVSGPQPTLEPGAEPEQNSITVFGDTRIFPSIGGAAAALSALYPETGGYAMYDIDQNSGVGRLAFFVTTEEIISALAAAAESGASVLLAESTNTTMYALPSGECQINGFYPDGKPFSYSFDCA